MHTLQQTRKCSPPPLCFFAHSPHSPSKSKSSASDVRRKFRHGPCLGFGVLTVSHGARCQYGKLLVMLPRSLRSPSSLQAIALLWIYDHKWAGWPLEAVQSHERAYTESMPHGQVSKCSYRVSHNLGPEFETHHSFETKLRATVLLMICNRKRSRGNKSLTSTTRNARTASSLEFCCGCGVPLCTFQMQASLLPQPSPPPRPMAKSSVWWPRSSNCCKASLQST